MATRNATVFQVIRTGQNYQGRIDAQHGTMGGKVVEALIRFDDGTEASVSGAADDELQTRKTGDRLITRPCIFNDKRLVVIGKLIF